MMVKPTCDCDHPLYVVVLGKFYCAHCWSAFARSVPFTSGGVRSARYVA